LQRRIKVHRSNVLPSEPQRLLHTHAIATRPLETATAIGAEQLNEQNHVQPHAARLGANHGYLIDGDVAHLHADIEGWHAGHSDAQWALQLWACDTPHTGGALAGIKVAETPLTGRADAFTPSLRLDAAADAVVPGGQRDYAMVLVLASSDDGQQQVHDFANYPARQRFMTPHFDGRVGYFIDDDHVVLEVEAIRNPRANDNMSGSLSLELRAVAHPYRGGRVEGHLLGRADLGRLAGQESLNAIAARIPFTPPASGEWDVVMTVSEWTEAAGYVTRDHARFAIPYLVVNEPAVSSPEDVAPVTLDAVDDARPARPVEPVAEPPAHAEPAPAPETTPRRRADAAAAGVSVNHATVDEIAAIKGMSLKLAKQIVKGRPYSSVAALLDVRGIGPKLLEKLRPYLSI
jgi:hypothetical protein